VTASGPLERLQSLHAATADDPRLAPIACRPIALGWATVELDRAAVELGAALDLPAARFVEVDPTPALGARCRIARGVLPTGMTLVLLEPNTEGRLAASLARHGEGPAAVWLAVGDLPAALAGLRSAGLATSVERPGPLGAELLLLDGPIDGPHRLVVERPGTIRA